MLSDRKINTLLNFYNRVREAKMTDEDEATLKTRVTTLDDPNHFMLMPCMFMALMNRQMSTIQLCYRNSTHQNTPSRAQTLQKTGIQDR